jgi:membrane-associated protease RseP (regulator of RpoE activity)
VAGLTTNEGYAIAAGVVLAYAIVVVALYRAGRIGPDRTLSLFGPALMLKTKRGNALLDRVGRFQRLWSFLGDFGLWLAAVSMVGIVALLSIEAVLVTRIPSSAAPQVSEALAIPGLNPIIPLGYGIVALVVGIVLHELMHGVMARSQKIGVKTVGVLWLVVPIGAFVEQEEEEMMSARRRSRGRVAAAGIFANFALALVFFLLLSGAVAATVTPNADGVGIGYVLPGFPASNATLAAGDILTVVNGTPVTTVAQLQDALDRTLPNETIAITFVPAGSQTPVSTTVRLTSAESYDHDPADADKGFLGIALTYLTPAELKGELDDPLASPFGPLPGAVFWIVLPLAYLEPVQGSTVQFFHLAGPLAALGPTGFWVLANILFWLAWINLLLGMSNALPLVPLDGGLLFRDFVGSVAARVKRTWSEEMVDKFSGQAVAVSTALVIFLLVWEFIGPRL